MLEFNLTNTVAIERISKIETRFPEIAVICHVYEGFKTYRGTGDG